VKPFLKKKGWEKKHKKIRIQCSPKHEKKLEKWKNRKLRISIRYINLTES